MAIKLIPIWLLAFFFFLRQRYCNWVYTQSPFGCSKFKPSALALKRFWDLNGVAVVRE